MSATLTETRQDRVKTNVRSAQKAATRAAILDAAVSCFSRSGLEACTMEEIAHAAGVSKGLVHYHFETKELLLIECERWLIDGLFQRIHASTRLTSHTPENALQALDEVWMELNQSAALFPLLFHLGLRALSHGQSTMTYADFIEEHRQTLREGVRLVLGPLVEGLTIDVETFTELLLVFLLGLLMENMLGNDPGRADRVYQECRKLLLTFFPGSSAPQPVPNAPGKRGQR